MASRVDPICQDIRHCFGKEFLHGKYRCTILKSLNPADMQYLRNNCKVFYEGGTECPFCKEKQYYTGGKYYPL